MDSGAAIAVGPGAFVGSTGAGIDFGTYVGGDVGIGVGVTVGVGSSAAAGTGAAPHGPLMVSVKLPVRPAS